MAKLIPRNISYTHSSGRLFVDLSCEGLVTSPTKSYEVTCPSEPDNEPDQPQDENPTEPIWPDIAEPQVLTRNSWNKQGIASQSCPKTITELSFISPNIKKLFGGSVIGGNIVSSNQYS